MISDIYNITASWGPRDEDAEACAVRLGQMLDGLLAIHPLFAGWRRIVGTTSNAARTSFCALPTRLDELTGIVELNKYHDRPREGREGYGYLLRSFVDIADPASCFLYMRIGASSRDLRLPNYVSLTMDLRETPGFDMPALDFFKPVLLTLITAWEPDFAVLDTQKARLQRHDTRSLLFRSGWMTYLTTALADHVSPPADALVKRLERGVLILANDGAFSAENSGHMCAVDSVQAALRPLEP